MRALGDDRHEHVAKGHQHAAVAASHGVEVVRLNPEAQTHRLRAHLGDIEGTAMLGKWTGVRIWHGY